MIDQDPHILNGLIIWRGCGGRTRKHQLGVSCASGRVGREEWEGPAGSQLYVWTMATGYNVKLTWDLQEDEQLE